MTEYLSNYFDVKRRYLRSINLERDIDDIHSIDGYLLTTRSTDSLRRILIDLTSKQSSTSWSLTGVYGTGKSAFAHYISCLCGARKDPLTIKALQLTKKYLGERSFEIDLLEKSIPSQGLFRGIATAQQEPLVKTILRSLRLGTKLFWPEISSKASAILEEISNLESEISSKEVIDGQKVIRLLQTITEVTDTNIIIVIDELGKCLEFASQNRSLGDLYLLQQLSEFCLKNHKKIYLLGILHQSFSEYSRELSSKETNEWIKIQGRFEEIPFTESPNQLVRLVGQVISHKKAKFLHDRISKVATDWLSVFESNTEIEDISSSVLASTYPLHPIALLILPRLCLKYAQNDRSLFTFLTSFEPYSLRNFLNQTPFDENKLIYLKLHQIYDYFIESVGMNMASKPNLQRWIEVHSLVEDVQKLDTDSLSLIKTIGVFNLATSASSMRATKQLVILAMCDNPKETKTKDYWESVIEKLMARGLIFYRRQLDELRIWEGSDFDIESEISSHVEKQNFSLVSLLSSIHPLKPQIAQRHSYNTGMLRCFEKIYVDSSTDLNKLRCSRNHFDGVIGYWLEKETPSKVPVSLKDGKPLILICGKNLDLLKIRASELTALEDIDKQSPQLQTDGVARREVKYRLAIARKLFEETLFQNFFSNSKEIKCFIEGKEVTLFSSTLLNTTLSDICDKTYSKKFILWNELINRRELTSQGAKARRQLIEAMLSDQSKEYLGLKGNGPEVSLYISTLAKTGIHRLEGDGWGFYPPLKKEVSPLWDAVETFCLQAKEKQKNLSLLYQKLEMPPYGIKSGVIPIFIAAVLLHHTDDVSIHRDGTFIPVLGAEHFELLVKDPSRFSVKHFEISGLRAQIFKELEEVLRKPNRSSVLVNIRNITLLSIVKPLFLFVKKLPAYTLKTKSISLEAQKVIQTLSQAQEPDELLFCSLPKACGLSPILISETENYERAKNFRTKLVQILREIQSAYDALLARCQELLYEAFGVQSERTKLRERLRVRASYLVDKCIEPTLKRFLYAAKETESNDKEWLEALVMVTADKPLESWSDEDIIGFETKLSEISRRFKNLESLRLDKNNSIGEGFEARRITITYPDGHETNRVVWIDNEQKAHIEKIIEKFFLENTLINDKKLQIALVTKLAEKVLTEGLQEKTDTNNYWGNDEQKSQAYSRSVRRKR